MELVMVTMADPTQRRHGVHVGAAEHGNEVDENDVIESLDHILRSVHSDTDAEPVGEGETTQPDRLAP